MKRNAYAREENDDITIIELAMFVSELGTGQIGQTKNVCSSSLLTHVAAAHATGTGRYVLHGEAGVGIYLVDT